MYKFSNSKMLKSCHHEDSCLTIEFANGAKYKYEGVPIDEYHRLTKAGSAGRHFGEYIRGKYKHTKLDK